MKFTPSWHEFKNFSDYIKQIERDEGIGATGIAKIIPPKKWRPKWKDYKFENIIVSHPSYGCQVVSGGQGIYKLLNLQDDKLTLTDWEMNTRKRIKVPNYESYDEVDDLYWNTLTCSSNSSFISDSPGSLMNSAQKEWNLDKLETCLDFIGLDHLNKPTGINRSFLKFGSWKYTDAWHLEELNLYSINYLHFGKPKTWYAMPPSSRLKFEKLTQQIFPKHYETCPAFLNHRTVLLAPSFLRKQDIPCHQVIQEVGEIIITFPNSYHFSYDHDINCTESTLFATPKWIQCGREARHCLCRNNNSEKLYNTLKQRLHTTGHRECIEPKLKTAKSQSDDVASHSKYKNIEALLNPSSKTSSKWITIKSAPEESSTTNVSSVAGGLDDLTFLPTLYKSTSPFFATEFLSIPSNLSKENYDVQFKKLSKGNYASSSNCSGKTEVSHYYKNKESNLDKTNRSSKYPSQWEVIKKSIPVMLPTHREELDINLHDDDICDIITNSDIKVVNQHNKKADHNDKSISFNNDFLDLVLTDYSSCDPNQKEIDETNPLTPSKPSNLPNSDNACRLKSTCKNKPSLISNDKKFTHLQSLNLVSGQNDHDCSGKFCSVCSMYSTYFSSKDLGYENNTDVDSRLMDTSGESEISFIKQ